MLSIDRDDYDPPDTATPELLDELTPLEDETPVDVDVDADPEVAVDEEGDVDLEVVEPLVEATGVVVGAPGIK